MSRRGRNPEERLAGAEADRVGRKRRRRQRRLELRLSLFLELADALMATPVLSQVDSFSRLSVSYERGRGTTWSVAEPTQDQLTLVVHRMRPVFLDDWTNLELPEAIAIASPARRGELARIVIRNVVVRDRQVEGIE